jgi:hypothetical protein
LVHALAFIHGAGHLRILLKGSDAYILFQGNKLADGSYVLHEVVDTSRMVICTLGLLRISELLIVVIGLSYCKGGLKNPEEVAQKR